MIEFGPNQAIQLVISIAVVLGLIILMAILAKRLKFPHQSSGSLSIKSSLAISSKDRVIVIQCGSEQILLGVSPGRVNYLAHLQSVQKSSISPQNISIPEISHE